MGLQVTESSRAGPPTGSELQTTWAYYGVDMLRNVGTEGKAIH